MIRERFEPCGLNVARGTGTVTAAAPAAARIGIEVLRAGGNAFDAAVAACAMEAVWLPMKCGPAGDVVALVLEKGKTLRCLLSIGRGVAALDRGCVLSEVGPRSIGAPGAPAGYAALAALGRFSFPDLVEPAAVQAERGFNWLPYAVDLTHEAELQLRASNGAIPFLPENRLPKAGEPLVLPGLAEVLRSLAKSGAALFRGEIGAALVAKVAAGGGFLSMTDFEDDPSRWMELEPTALAGGELFVTPSPTHGPIVAGALAELMAGGDGDTVQAFRRAKARFDADGGEGTSVVTAADRDGNAVVVVHSNSYPQYGSGVVVEAYDLILNNRPGRGFTLDSGPDHWNAPKAGRIPATTLNAWAFLREKKWWLGATPGGPNQAPWNIQALQDLLLGEEDLDRLVTAPRWGFEKKGGLAVEAGHNLPPPQAREVPPFSMRSAEQIVCVDMEKLDITAAADPRIGAVALGCDVENRDRHSPSQKEKFS